jgi:hypothetical protein
MSVKEQIRLLSSKYAKALDKKIQERVLEMKEDDTSHFLLYKVLGVSETDGELIDIYQNKGRFLYKYAGAFLEEAVFLCFKEKFPKAKKARVENTIGKRPKLFEIDCLIDNDAIEVKWRDATTDGDHIVKEHTRVQVIKSYGYKPIRLMFYQPNRLQAIKIQATLKTLYEGIEGEFYSQKDAWNYVKTKTGIDLKAILNEIAEENFRAE